MKPARTIGPALALRLGIFLSFAAFALSQTPSAPPLPKEMAEQVSEDTGRPVILDYQRGPLIWGLSTKRVAYGQPIPLLLWLYNPTDKPAGVATCSDIGFFWTFRMSVFDSSGERVLSREEQRMLSDLQKPPAEPRFTIVPVCARNFSIYIPPHTIRHGNFSTLEFDFSWDLREHYSLSPGRYVIVASELDQNFRRIEKTLSNPQSGLQIEITEP